MLDCFDSGVRLSVSLVRRLAVEGAGRFLAVFAAVRRAATSTPACQGTAVAPFDYPGFSTPCFANSDREVDGG